MKRMRSIRVRLLRWYAACGRMQLPWRRTRLPYRVLVSEFMLQQTQVDRVVPKYADFVERFPTVEALAAASRADVLRAWRGLGYNSRALRLQQLAQIVVERFAGVIPGDTHALRDLPGVGAYTAAAIRAFAFERDDAAVDTNVRRIIHRLLHGVEYPARVEPAVLERQARELVPQGRGHDWNSAMMDLGATICTARAPKCRLCPLRTCCAAAPLGSESLERLREEHRRARSPQEGLRFELTTRHARGRIIDRLRELPSGERISLLVLHREIGGAVDRSREELNAIVAKLEKEGLVTLRGRLVALPE